MPRSAASSTSMPSAPRLSRTRARPRTRVSSRLSGCSRASGPNRRICDGGVNLVDVHAGPSPAADAGAVQRVRLDLAAAACRGAWASGTRPSLSRRSMRAQPASGTRGSRPRASGPVGLGEVVTALLVLGLPLEEPHPRSLPRICAAGRRGGARAPAPGADRAARWRANPSADAPRSRRGGSGDTPPAGRSPASNCRARARPRIDSRLGAGFSARSSAQRGHGEQRDHQHRRGSRPGGSAGALRGSCGVDSVHNAWDVGILLRQARFRCRPAPRALVTAVGSKGVARPAGDGAIAGREAVAWRSSLISCWTRSASAVWPSCR